MVFGDGLNNFSMFKIGSECYVVGIALYELKQLATCIIGVNDDDAGTEFVRRCMENM